MTKKLKFFAISYFACLAFVLLPAIFAVADETYDIHVRYQSGDFHNVSSQILHDGHVIIKDFENDEEPRALPLNVEATIKFSQRFTGTSELLAIRKYDESSNASIKVSDGKSTTILTEKNRYLIARIKGEGPIQTASLEDVLSQPEHEMITNPVDPLSFAKLFEKSKVSIGQKWDVADEALSSFLSVDRVYENKVQMQLREIKGNLAKIYIIGEAKAEIDDVTNHISISASAVIDMKANSLTAIRATLKQDRAIGQIAPGFEGTTKVDLRMTATDEVAELSNSEITKRTQSKRIERRLKWESEEGRFSLLYNPDWRMIASENEAAVLRYIKNGNLIAQCNVVQLPARPANNMLKLANFKAEVEKIIAKEESARIIDAKQSQTSNGLQALEVQVDGIEKEVPVSWIYYHVGHQDGRQLTFVFTLEKERAGEFQPADKHLVNALVFLPKQNDESSKTRAAKKTTAGSIK